MPKSLTKISTWVGALYVLNLLWVVLWAAANSDNYNGFVEALGYLNVWHVLFIVGLPVVLLLVFIMKAFLTQARRAYLALSMDDRLLKTKELYDAGVLTEAEYEERLARIKAR